MGIPSVLCWSLPHFQNGGFYREKVYCIEALNSLSMNTETEACHFSETGSFFLVKPEVKTPDLFADFIG